LEFVDEGGVIRLVIRRRLSVSDPVSTIVASCAAPVVSS
jgi:hypothetical protein